MHIIPITALAFLLLQMAAACAEPSERFPSAVATVGQNILIPCAIVRKHATPDFLARAEREAGQGGRPALEAIHAHFLKFARACEARR